MPISLILTPYDHFQILPTLAVNPNLILEPCHMKTIPHICHLDHLYIGGEKIGHVEKFQISIPKDVEKSGILPDLKEFQNSTHEECKEI